VKALQAQLESQLVANGGKALHGRLLLNEPMARYTSWAVGGPADVLYRPSDVEDLARFMALLPLETQVHWVGLGSNLLVRDAGVRGVVVLLKATMQEFKHLEDGVVEAGAGVTCTKLARQVADWGYADSAFFAGIPGTLGGALAMNAGAHGGETWQQVEAVQLMSRQGELRWSSPDEWDIGYRHAQLKSSAQDCWFVAARLRFAKGDAEASMAAIRDLQAHRAATQPLDQRSCGSVFRNPESDYSARLIESCGLKGQRRGGAEVSSKHANFIVNADKASAADIEALILEVRETVAQQCGVELHPEVRIIGEAA
jgi:UDP-N-acetylmuramate dehydrogenase